MIWRFIRGVVIGLAAGLALGLLVWATVLTVAGVGEPPFRDTFPAEFAANFIGTLVAGSIAVYLFIYEQRREHQRQGEAQGESERDRVAEDLERRRRVAGLLLHDLQRQFKWIEERRVGGSSGISRVLSVQFLNNGLWTAISNAGELRYLGGWPPLVVLADAYEALGITGFLERRWYEAYYGPPTFPGAGGMAIPKILEREVEGVDPFTRTRVETAINTLIAEGIEPLA